MKTLTHVLIISYDCPNPMCKKVHAEAIELSGPIDILNDDELMHALERAGLNKIAKIVAIHQIPITEPKLMMDTVNSDMNRTGKPLAFNYITKPRLTYS